MIDLRLHQIQALLTLRAAHPVGVQVHKSEGGNGLTDLPKAIVGLPNLEKLDLRWNHDLTRFPRWLETLEDRGCIVFR